MTTTRGTRLGKLFGFLIGCAVLFAFVVIGIGAFFFVEYTDNWRIQRASQTAPIEIEGHGLSTDELTSLKLRVDAFTNGENRAEKPKPLTLSADEMTALVAPSVAEDTVPEEAAAEDPLSKLRFECEDGMLFIRGSIDLAEWGYDGRHLNGRLWVFIDKTSSENFQFSLEDVKGHPNVTISGRALRALGLKNITRYAYGHPQLSSILRSAERIELQDQTMILHPKSL